MVIKLIKNIPLFLLLVMAFQMLPIRQAVKYFLVDNQTTEELAHLDKTAAKNYRLLDEDHKWIYEAGQLSAVFIPLTNAPVYHFEEMLPLNRSSDIHTPPPNKD